LKAASTPLSSDRYTPWRTSSITVSSFYRHTDTVYTIDLSFERVEEAEAFSFSPGQFNMLYVPGVGEAAISIAGRSRDGSIRHTIRAVGAVTQSIEGGGKGMSLGMRGPFGVGWPLTKPVEEFGQTESLKDVVIVGGGIGLAPLRSMIEHIKTRRASFGKVDVLVGARTPEDLLYREEYAQWQAADIGVGYIVDQCPVDWQGMVGVVTVLLQRLPIPRPSQTILMTCGPEIMMRYVADTGISRGISNDDVYLALERNMNCAVGFCGHCQFGPAFICKEGPVFRYNAVSDLLRFRDL
jgi:NAD(P)H-flavin reductase